MNPVLRESLEVFFVEGRGLPVYFYLLVILAPVEFLALYMPTLGAQMWSGPGNLFAMLSSVAVLLIAYFAMRVANQEYAPRRFKPLEHWLREGGLSVGSVVEGRVAFLCVNIVFLLLLAAPLLIWAAAISRVPLAGLAATLALIPFYAFCYGVWGLVALVMWESEPDNRELAVRCFLGFVVVAALAVYLPLNPVIYMLAIVAQQEPPSITATTWPAGSVHFGFHVAFGAGGLVAFHQALRRRLKPVTERRSATDTAENTEKTLPRQHSPSP
jgi:hypothetical protein